MYLLVYGSYVSLSEVHIHFRGHSFSQEGHNNTAVQWIWIAQCLIHPHQGWKNSPGSPSPASRRDRRDFTVYINLFNQEFELRVLPYQGELRENPRGDSTLSQAPVNCRKVTPVSWDSQTGVCGNSL